MVEYRIVLLSHAQITAEAGGWLKDCLNYARHQGRQYAAFFFNMQFLVNVVLKIIQIISECISCLQIWLWYNFLG